MLNRKVHCLYSDLNLSRTEVDWCCVEVLGSAGHQEVMEDLRTWPIGFYFHFLWYWDQFHREKICISLIANWIIPLQHFYFSFQQFWSRLSLNNWALYYSNTSSILLGSNHVLVVFTFVSLYYEIVALQWEIYTHDTPISILAIFCEIKIRLTECKKIARI